MRDLRVLNVFRLDMRAAMGWSGDHTCGAFEIRSPIDDAKMFVMASSDGDWDHVSVSRANRCPNWREMDYAKDLFFKPDETVMQLHVPQKDHINNHPFCLHLWRPQKTEIPRPPSWMVGIKLEQTG